MPESTGDGFARPGSVIAAPDRNRVLVESLTDYAIYLLDPNGIVSSWNTGAERLKGWSSKEIVGRHFSAFYTPEDVALAKPQRDLSAAAAEGVARDEGWRVRKDGARFWAETSITALRDDNGKLSGFAKITRDRSDHKAAEDELRRRQTLLAEANSNLDAFAAAVAHDLRAPIRQILGFSRLLTEDYAGALDDEGRRRVQKIEDGARRMGCLVDDLLMLSKVDRTLISRKNVPLGALARDIAAELSAESQGRRIEWRIGALFDAQCDPGLMRQVFVNLLSNALKFTRPRELAVVEIEATTTESGERAVVVRDNGVGFDMRYAAKLFGVFERLHSDREFEGTGVGLATVDRILRRHGGRIWARAEPGIGASFYFTPTSGAVKAGEP